MTSALTEFGDKFINAALDSLESELDTFENGKDVSAKILVGMGAFFISPLLG